MKTVITPPVGSLNNDEWAEFQEKWKTKVKNDLGIRPVYVSPLYEYSVREDVLYARSLSRPEGRLFLSIDKTAKPTDAPEVMCPCGSTSFSLRYGDYEIKARCVKCGIEDDVYSG